jgi:hypothetical protein
MKFQTRLLVVSAYLVAGLATSVWAQNPSPLGTWNLNLTKSKFAPGRGPKSLVMKIEAAGMGTTSTIDMIGADDYPSHWTYTANYDGKDVPVIGNNPFGLTGASQKRINATTTETTFKEGGKVTGKSRFVLSADAKTLTIAVTSIDGKGRPTSSVQMYDKQ